MKVVNKVSEDADFLMESATDATEQAIAWTLKLYQIVGLLISFVMLWGSYKWANSMGLTKPLPAADPSGPAPDTATLFAQYGDWLTESKVRSVARNPTGALNIAAVSSNIRPMPDGEGLSELGRIQWGACAEYKVTGEKSNLNYSVILSTSPQVWMIAAKGDDVARLVEGCNCKDAIFRGPICKHAAACLIAERRRVHSPIADGHETPAGQKSSSTTSKWLLERFRTLTVWGDFVQKKCKKRSRKRRCWRLRPVRTKMLWL
jgi:hypothetical protein